MGAGPDLGMNWKVEAGAIVLVVVVRGRVRESA